LQQILNWGSYLQALKDLYEGEEVPLVKQVLSDMGVIDSPTYSLKTEKDMGEKVDRLKTLMKQNGDYPQ
jgi:hypothetical protein